MLQKPDILLLDEPTQGVDVGARREIYELLRERSRSGLSIILASTDFEELGSLSDRVLIMKRGSIAHVVEPPDINVQNLTHAVYEDDGDTP